MVSTHHGVFDLAYLRIIPNIIVAVPLNERELRNMMYSAQLKPNGPYAIRYPRGRGVLANWHTDFEYIETGKGRLLTEGSDLAVLSVGHPGNFVQKAIERLKEQKLNPAHYDMRFVKPLDEMLLHEVMQNFDRILCVEDGSLIGGFGSAVEEFASANNYKPLIRKIGIPDHFIEQGEIGKLYKLCGLDAESIQNTITLMLSAT